MTTVPNDPRLADVALSWLRDELASACNGIDPVHRHYCLFGSAVMYLHGMDIKPDDIDLFVSPALYDELRDYRGWQEIEEDERKGSYIEIGAGFLPPLRATWYWKPGNLYPPPIVDLLYNPGVTETVQGWPCQPLSMLADWYWKINRSTKPDREKAQTIWDHLGVATLSSVLD